MLAARQIERARIHMSFPACRSVTEMQRDWCLNARWAGIARPYPAEEVERLRGTVLVEHSRARLGADMLWRYIRDMPFVIALGALTGNQAMQQVRAERI